jgi:hypothetical protein
MTDDVVPSAAPDVPASAATEISFCPHLNLYHYKRADKTEYFFNTQQLEQSVEAYAKAGAPKQAEFMAVLTGFARRFPHKVVSFDGSGQLNLRDLLPQGLPADTAEAGATGGDAPPK